jgi:hypothetical protein
MLSTNQVFIAAAAIRLAPRPTRVASPGMAH